jgi:hypothetical protein
MIANEQQLLAEMLKHLELASSLGGWTRRSR